jgi:hypothetical protein
MYETCTGDSDNIQMELLINKIPRYWSSLVLICQTIGTFVTRWQKLKVMEDLRTVCPNIPITAHILIWQSDNRVSLGHSWPLSRQNGSCSSTLYGLDHSHSPISIILKKTLIKCIYDIVCQTKIFWFTGLVKMWDFRLYLKASISNSTWH